MKMKTTLKMLVAVMAVISLGTLAACKAHHGHDPGKLKEHVEASLKKVGATKEQQAKIGVVTDRILADGGELCKKNQGLGRQFSDALLQEEPNQEWLHQAVDEKAKELTAFAHRTVDSLIEISGMLTVEQRTKLKSKYDAAHGTKQSP